MMHPFKWWRERGASTGLPLHCAGAGPAGLCASVPPRPIGSVLLTFIYAIAIIDSVAQAARQQHVTPHKEDRTDGTERPLPGVTAARRRTSVFTHIAAWAGPATAETTCLH